MKYINCTSVLINGSKKNTNVQVIWWNNQITSEPKLGVFLFENLSNITRHIPSFHTWMQSESYTNRNFKNSKTFNNF